MNLIYIILMNNNNELINNKVLILGPGYSYFCCEHDLRLYVCVHEHSVVFFCAPHAG